jgi:hypothetical protein
VRGWLGFVKLESARLKASKFEVGCVYAWGTNSPATLKIDNWLAQIYLWKELLAIDVLQTRELSQDNEATCYECHAKTLIRRWAFVWWWLSEIFPLFRSSSSGNWKSVNASRIKFQPPWNFACSINNEFEVLLNYNGQFCIILKLRVTVIRRLYHSGSGTTPRYLGNLGKNKKKIDYEVRSESRLHDMQVEFSLMLGSRTRKRLRIASCISLPKSLKKLLLNHHAGYSNIFFWWIDAKKWQEKKCSNDWFRSSALRVSSMSYGVFSKDRIKSLNPSSRTPARFRCATAGRVSSIFRHNFVG